MGDLKIVEVRCPKHGLLYERAMAYQLQMSPVDARELREGTFAGTCNPCLSDGVPKPHTHLLWATERAEVEHGGS